MGQSKWWSFPPQVAATSWARPAPQRNRSRSRRRRQAQQNRRQIFARRRRRISLIALTPIWLQSGGCQHERVSEPLSWRARETSLSGRRAAAAQAARAQQVVKMKATRRALLLANTFNLLVAIYFVIIAIVALIELRWYHQLTVTVRVRHFITTATSYSAFFLLIFVGLVLVGIFAGSTSSLCCGTRDEAALPSPPQPAPHKTTQTYASAQVDAQPVRSSRKSRRRRLILRQETTAESQEEPHEFESWSSDTKVCCLILFHLVASIGLVTILVVWLCNTGELVRDSISTQLEMALAKYQFTNRSNHYSIAVDGLQDTNNCCGSIDYTDFPRQRVSGLSAGLYPGSCCGKNVFGVNARVLCTPEEIWRARQTAGCTTVLAKYYDLISLLVIPVALVCLFVNITLIATITISKGNNVRLLLLGHGDEGGRRPAAAAIAPLGRMSHTRRDSPQLLPSPPPAAASDRFELKPVG